MPRAKPIGWPKYMVAKGKRVESYFFEIPTWAKKRGCPIKSEALGRDYALAKKRCDEVLNPQLTAWRIGGVSHNPNRPREGCWDWMVALYKTAPKYTDLPAKTKKSYDAALALVSKHVLLDGRTFGQLNLKSVTPGAADRLFAKIRVRSDGIERTRTAVLCMATAKIAWNVAMRDRPALVPSLNPFMKMNLKAYKAKPTRPVTLEELFRFVAEADRQGDPSLGTAAMLAFFWYQRQVDIRERLQWNAYRPKTAPNTVNVFHHKTGEPVVHPLYDEDGTPLYPELMQRLDSAPRRGTLIVTRDKLDRKRNVFLPWSESHFKHRVAAIRDSAGIDAEVKFMGLRHGGNTAAADAGATDAEIRSLSGHRTAAMTVLYAKQSMKQRREGARKLLKARTKGGNLSE